MLGSLATGIVALVGVILGGLITSYNQERLWRRDEARRWRETRLTAYTEFPRHAREVAAARSNYAVGAIPVEQFDAVWKAERRFLGCARDELGLPRLPTDPRDAADL